jgi:ubiquinone/menaquinone biosynthesis C-methylase UbiE
MQSNHPPDDYAHGHHESVLRSHGARTVANSAAYLVPHLVAGARILDVGSGPGSITIDLAQRVAPGAVTGIEPVPAVVERATAAIPDSVDNLCFESGDVYALDYADASFDVVHAHQVLQHLREPIAALREMRRVLRPGGILAVRDADYGGMVWAPESPSLTRWMSIYQSMGARLGVNPNAGRHLLGWTLAAGFERIEPAASAWTYATPDQRSFWARTWAERAVASDFATHALEMNLATEAELYEIADAWRSWEQQPSGFFLIPNTEILAWR